MCVREGEREREMVQWIERDRVRACVCVCVCMDVSTPSFYAPVVVGSCKSNSSVC